MFQALFDRLWANTRSRASRTRQVGIVRQGKRYRANVNLSWGEAMVASNEMIAAKLTEAGFSEVRVTGSGGVRTAQAFWPGADRQGEIDPHLSDVTEIA